MNRDSKRNVWAGIKKQRATHPRRAGLLPGRWLCPRSRLYTWAFRRLHEPRGSACRFVRDATCRICPQVPYFSSDRLIPKTRFSSDNLAVHAASEDRRIHLFPQFPKLQTPHYHDCANCRRSFACVCRTPREKIFCLQCWEKTQQGEAREALRAG